MVEVRAVRAARPERAAVVARADPRAQAWRGWPEQEWLGRGWPARATPTTRRPTNESSLLAPEELPRVVLEIASELLDVVVELLVHHQRTHRAFAMPHVGDD